MQNYCSLQEVRADMTAGKLSVVDLVAYYRKRIDEQKHLNAFIEVFDDAQEQAAEVDRKWKAGTAGKLAGMVIGIKDLICYKNHHVAASSKILDGFTSVYSSTVVERLLAEDAVIIGRLNCDEFAMGASNQTSYYGAVKNAADPTKVPGGSSGGSAVAVQADLCLAALGTDTGGSVRQPASFCNVIGMKPTYGRVSRWGIIAYASSFDQVGPVTKSIEDAALLMEIMAGKDAYDSTASSQPVPAYSQLLQFDTKTSVAYLPETLDGPGLDPEIRKKVVDTLELLKTKGHQVKEERFSLLDQVVPAYYVLTTAEASSNLSRYDGVHFGYRSPAATDLESVYKKSRSEGFGTEVKRRIMLGTFVLSAGYYDAYYSKAQKVRRLIQEETLAMLEENEFIVLPTAPTTAFGLGDNLADPVAMYLADIYTVQASLAGLPAISIPAGLHSNGMPFGIQIIGRKLEEEKLFAFAKYLIEII